MSNRLAAIADAGTSIWLDDLSRDRLVDRDSNHSLSRLITTSYVTGVTTNPAIFSQAISKSSLYADDIARLAKNGMNAEEIISELTIADVQIACDYFREVFERTGGVDGRVSIEVDPRLARDTAQTIAQAHALWKRVDRPNVLIKVPATVEGLPAITELTAAGISVNVTIIFSVTRYREVFAAFCQGLHERLNQGLPISHIHSVASFFVSRVDTEVDARLIKIGAEHLCGKAAIANAHLAYEAFQAMKALSSWQSVADSGGHIQRPLWASTGVKDPRYPDDRYVVELVAPETVNTMPEATLDAVRDHSECRGDAITGSLSKSQALIQELATFGIAMDEVAEKLESEGLDKFVTPWLALIELVQRHADTVRG